MLYDLDRLTVDTLQLVARGPAPDAASLTFLLRRYRATERADVRGALEPALGLALAQPEDQLKPAQRAGCLFALVEALPIADDERVRAAIETLMVSCRSGWGASSGFVDDIFLGIDACLQAAGALEWDAAVQPAIDELERVVGSCYKPGEGLSHSLAAGGSRGGLSDHIRCASALLTAFASTARLPYAMLAEELVQFARRALWNERDASFVESPDARERPFTLNCAAVVVLCRLAALHADDGYRGAAVIANGADYRADAGRMLDALSARLPGLGFERADYALALSEWLVGS